MGWQTCAVFDCEEPVRTRYLCSKHYRAWLRGRGRTLGPRLVVAGLPMRYRRPVFDPDPLVCVCEELIPDGLGECARCGRLVVTFVSTPLRPTYEAQYPEQWARAVEQGYEKGREL